MGGNEARDARNPGHYWLDNEVYDQYRADIMPYGYLVYTALCRHADTHGQSFPSIPTLAKELGISVSSVRRGLDQLESVKLIDIQHRPANPGKKKGPESNIYTVLPVKKDPKYGGYVPTDSTPPVSQEGPPIPETVPLLSDRHPEKNQDQEEPVKNSGGDRAREATPQANAPPPLDVVMMGLLYAGLTPTQAKDAIPQQPFPPETLEALGKWADRLRAKGVNPGKTLVGYTRVGRLPDDLPKVRPKSASKVLRADGSIDYEALRKEYDAKNERIKNDPSFYRPRAS